MIYKYLLGLGENQTIQIPYGSEILSAQAQNGELCIWANITPGYTIKRKIRVYAIGEPHVPGEKTRFIDTVQFNKGTFVVHVFEVLD